MRTAFPVQELPVRSALTVAANCVNRTRKHAASVTAYSVLRACPSIQRSTRSLHQQTTGTFESGKELRERLTKEAFCAPLNISLAPHFHLPLDLSVLRKYDSCRIRFRRELARSQHFALFKRPSTLLARAN